MTQLEPNAMMLQFFLIFDRTQTEIDRVNRLNAQLQMQIADLRKPTLVAENERLREALALGKSTRQKAHVVLVDYGQPDYLTGAQMQFEVREQEMYSVAYFADGVDAQAFVDWKNSQLRTKSDKAL